jgi:hypothetical protein
MAKTTEPTDAGPSRQSSTQRIKSSRSSRDHLDDPVPTSLPTYPEVVPLEDEGAYRHQPEMASPPSSHGYPYQQERRYDQPPLDAYPQLHRDSDVTTSQALKVRHEGPSRSMRYAWHRTRLGFRGSSMILFYAALLTAIGRLSDAVRGDDYVDFWGNWVGDWRYGWCMVLITLVCVYSNLTILGRLACTVQFLTGCLGTCRPIVEYRRASHCRQQWPRYTPLGPNPI